ncbi:hypothetical protein QUA35_03325 [Microcoleus sp. N9_B2]|uniref:hypothetical protein n=1 Tax=Microcoleus sp. N9_A2 TaxID=3055381 RepID=UPI002FD55470
MFKRVLTRRDTKVYIEDVERAIALNPSNLPIYLHLMYFVRQLLATFLIECINCQHSQINDFLLGESGRLGLFLNDFLNHGTDRDRSISFCHEE